MARHALSRPLPARGAAALKIDEIAGNSSELNTHVAGRLPDPGPGRAEPLHGVEPAGRARRTSTSGSPGGRTVDAPWGAPANLGEPVNSAADDFCPTPIHGGGLFFVSREALPGSCGMGDIYFARHWRRHGWSEPEHLACAPEGPNSALDEQGPSYVRAGRRAWLYFSSSSPTVPGDIYASAGDPSARLRARRAGGRAQRRAANDIQPNVRKDGLRDRLLIEPHGHARRSGHLDRDAPERPQALVGPGQRRAVNTAAAETRPSLSGWADRLLFGRAPGPEGMSDIYVSTR